MHPNPRPPYSILHDRGLLSRVASLTERLGVDIIAPASRCATRIEAEQLVLRHEIAAAGGVQ